MKTAMQELMDALNDLEVVYISNDWRREVIGINQAKNLIEYIYLKKEKEQTIDFAYECRNVMAADEFAITKWYDKTFNTKEK
jgi:hypothetical protein